MLVEVAFALPLNKTFHYRASNGSEPADPYIGRRVLAPFGKKTMVGYVVGTTTETPAFPIKPIHTWIDSLPLLDESLLELARWMSQKYLCSMGEALSAILPGQLRPPKRLRTEDSGLRTEKKTLLSPQHSVLSTIQLSPEQEKV